MNRKNLKTTSKNDEKPSSKKKIIVAVIIIAFAFFGSFLIYYIMSLALNTLNPMVVVTSGSMEPTIKTGDLLFLRGVDDAGTLKNGTIEGKEGDVIVYNAVGLWFGAPSEPIVHRIIEKWYNDTLKLWFFLTKGDANSGVDQASFSEDRIIGVVVGGIPYIGWIKIYLTNSGLLIPLLVILSALLIISIIWDIVKKEEEETEVKKKDKIKKSKKSLVETEFKEKPQKISKEKPKRPESDDFDF